MTTIFISLLTGSDKYGECFIDFPCLLCGAEHDMLWTIERKPFDTGLWWSGAWINGEKVLIEGSLPNRVTKLPRGAKRVSRAVAATVWHEDNESHVFGGPNVAKALREEIARSNASSSRA